MLYRALPGRGSRTGSSHSAWAVLRANTARLPVCRAVHVQRAIFVPRTLLRTTTFPALMVLTATRVALLTDLCVFLAQGEVHV